MSTDNFDDRLHAAGERWRAANPAVAQVNFEEIATADRTLDVPIAPVTDAPPQHRRRLRVMLASGAGVAAAVAATIVAVQLNGSSRSHRPQPLTGADGVQVVCSAAHPSTSAQLQADGAVISKRLQQLGARDGTVRVQGNDSLVISVPGGSEQSARNLCAQDRLDLRPVVMPAVSVSRSGATRNSNPFGALTFAIPANETDFVRLSAVEQGQLKAALARLDCAWAAGEPRSAATYSFACDGGNNLTARVAYLLGPAIVTGAEIATATAQAPNASAGQTQWAVVVTFTPSGQAAWSRYTGAHHAGATQAPGTVTQCGAAGTPCADYVSFGLDGVALSVPVSEAQITGPDTQITGDFTEASAKAIADRLSAGSLLVPLHVASTSALPDASPLVGTDWRLVTIVGRDGTPLVVSAPLMIDKTGQLTGTDGCNELGAHVTISGDTIKLGSVVSTEMGCIGRKTGFAAQVARLDAVLSGSVQWSIQGAELTLSKDGKAALVYRAAPPPTTDPKALVGIDWKLTGLATDGPNGVASTPAAPATLRFDGAGQLTGSDGCNSMGGHATISPGRLDGLTFGGTLVECPGAVHAQYMLLGRVLRGSSTWSIKDGQLTLTKAGVGSLSYQRAAGATPTTGSS